MIPSNNQNQKSSCFSVRINFHFRSAKAEQAKTAIGNAALEGARANQFKELISRCLSVYEVVLAGLEYNFDFTHFGFKLCVFGYSEKLPLSVRYILGYVLKLKFNATNFHAIKEYFIDIFRNLFISLSSHLDEGTEAILNCEHFPSSDLDAWRRMDMTDMNGGVGFWLELLDPCSVQVLIHGSLSENDALLVSDSIRYSTRKSDDSKSHQSLVKPYPRAYDYSPHEGIHIVLVPEPVSHQDNAISTLFPITLKNHHEHILIFIFEHILKECFFNVIRTKEQLGYSVNVGLHQISNIVYLSFIIQSDSDLIFLDERIESFFRDFFPNYLQALSAEEFENHRSALARSFAMKPSDLESECVTMWISIGNGSLDLESASVDAALLSETSNDALIQFFQTHIHPDGEKRIKLGVHIWSKHISDNPVNSYGSHCNGRIFPDRHTLVAELNLEPSCDPM